MDRGRACGDAGEEWWLDEVDFRDQPHADGREAAGTDLCYALRFTLHGDDGGLWTVEMRVLPAGHRPFRFERLQG